MERSCNTCKYKAVDSNFICALDSAKTSMLTEEQCAQYIDSPALVYDVSYIEETGVIINEHINLIDGVYRING